MKIIEAIEAALTEVYEAGRHAAEQEAHETGHGEPGTLRGFRSIKHQEEIWYNPYDINIKKLRKYGECAIRGFSSSGKKYALTFIPNGIGYQLKDADLIE